MSKKRAIGILAVIAGVVMIFTSAYIKKEVLKGKQRIGSAEAQVQQGEEILDIVPEIQPFGSAAVEKAEKRIAAGKKEVIYYEKVSKWLLYGGVALIVLGILLIWTGRKRV